jgi:hypothetical protein
MTNEQINIAIAEACGWQFVTYKETFAKPPNGGPCQYKEGIPNYYNDLNAMHEAEKVLTNEQWHKYDEELYIITGSSLLDEAQRKKRIHTTAPQKAEAFLKTLGKWEE